MQALHWHLTENRLPGDFPYEKFELALEANKFKHGELAQLVELSGLSKAKLHNLRKLVQTERCDELQNEWQRADERSNRTQGEYRQPKLAMTQLWIETILPGSFCSYQMNTKRIGSADAVLEYCNLGLVVANEQDWQGALDLAVQFRKETKRDLSYLTKSQSYQPYSAALLLIGERDESVVSKCGEHEVDVYCAASLTCTDIIASAKSVELNTIYSRVSDLADSVLTDPYARATLEQFYGLSAAVEYRSYLALDSDIRQKLVASSRCIDSFELMQAAWHLYDGRCSLPDEYDSLLYFAAREARLPLVEKLMFAQLKQELRALNDTHLNLCWKEDVLNLIKRY